MIAACFLTCVKDIPNIYRELIQRLGLSLILVTWAATATFFYELTMEYVLTNKTLISLWILIGHICASKELSQFIRRTFHVKQACIFTTLAGQKSHYL